MDCKNCGKELRDGSFFCSSCGAKVEKTHFCSCCEKEINDKSIFCPHCGVSIKKEEEQKTEITKVEGKEEPVEIINVENKKKDNIILYLTLIFSLLSFVISFINTCMIWYC